MSRGVDAAPGDGPLPPEGIPPFAAPVADPLGTPLGSALALAGLGTLGALAVAVGLAGWWPAAVVLHLVASGTALAVLAARRPGGLAEGRAGGALAAACALTPALGPVAALGGLVALAGAVAPAAAPELPPTDDPLEARLRAVADAPDLPPGLLVEALGDVLRWGTPAQKVRAVRLAGAAPPAGAMLLRLAIADPDPALRTAAEAARPAIAAWQEAEAARLRAAAAGPGPAGRRALARHLDEAAAAALAEPGACAAWRTEAVALWRAIAAGGGATPDDLAAAGRASLAVGQAAAARRALEAALAAGHPIAPLLPALGACLWGVRDFAALEALAARGLTTDPASDGPWQLLRAEAGR